MVQIGNLFPALRARMGDRRYYVILMSFAEVVRWVKPIEKTDEVEEFKRWMKEAAGTERAGAFAGYLLRKKSRFTNAVIVGINSGEPKWYPMEIGSQHSALREVRLTDRQAEALGFLHLTGKETVFAIAGRDRVEGIEEAICKDATLANEEMAVIIVAHKSTPDGRNRTIELVKALNK